MKIKLKLTRDQYKGVATIAQNCCNALVLGQLYDGKWDAELADVAQNLGASDNGTGLPTDTWSLTKFSVDDYKALFDKVAKGELTPSAEVPQDANNGDWLKGIDHVTVEFE